MPPAGVSTQALSSCGVFYFPPCTNHRPDHNNTNQGLSSSLQISDSGTPTTSESSTSNSASALTNSDVTAKLPLAGPMIAGVLVGIVVIAAMVVILFLQRRPQHPRRRRRSFEAQFILQPDSRPHRRDENPENATPKKKYRRYSRRSRYSSTRNMEQKVQNSVPPGGSRSKALKSSLLSSNRRWHSGSSSTNSTFSLTLNVLNTSDIGVNNPHHRVVDASQTSVTLVPSAILVSSNQVEHYSPPPTTILPLQPLSPSSEFIKTPNLINPSLLPEVGGEHLTIL